MSYIVEHRANNIWRGRFSLFPENEVVHGFSCRLGGKSPKPWESLDMGLHVGDAPERVFENRKLFLSSLSLRVEDVVTPEQVHGDRVLRVSAADAGRGAREYADAIKATDALITDTPDLPLLLCFADCVPLLFYDGENHAVGLAHGGWKGTVKRIAEKTIHAMTESFGTDPRKLIVGIGPSIGRCCFEVGDEVAAAFRDAFDGVSDIVTEREGKPHVDLWKANEVQFLAAGVPAGNIERADTCTSCKHAWYFSYRADGKDTGRMAAVIALRAQGKRVAS